MAIAKQKAGKTNIEILEIIEISCEVFMDNSNKKDNISTTFTFHTYLFFATRQKSSAF